jgi:hypothetical protein
MAMAEPGQVVVLHASRMLDVRAMATMKPKGIFAVPTVAILQYYVARRRRRESGPSRRPWPCPRASLSVKWRRECRLWWAAMWARFRTGGRHEMELMVEFGMPAADVLRADLLNGRSCWDGKERLVS